ncbi:MAG: hypothetical protein HC881_19275 [Leptolyngbyaceae cyanobacterium SL_7_1]|nr:hypothetical protein [Leptolyngbyaceae cyanobacterium SL_7_1]
MVESQFNQSNGKKNRQHQLSPDESIDTSFEVSALPLPSLAVTPSLLPPRAKSWRWVLVSMTACCMTGSVGVAALLLMTRVPPAADCAQTSPSPRH